MISPLSLSQGLDRLTSRLLRKRLFVVVLKATSPQQPSPILPITMNTWSQLARKGVLFASAAAGELGDGLGTFNTSTASEARELTERTLLSAA